LVHVFARELLAIGASVSGRHNAIGITIKGDGGDGDDRLRRKLAGLGSHHRLAMHEATEVTVLGDCRGWDRAAQV
jgi:hypothetical protein